MHATFNIRGAPNTFALNTRSNKIAKSRNGIANMDDDVGGGTANRLEG